MTDLNRVVIIGRLGSDPNTTSTQSGKKVSTFSIACNYSFGTGDSKREQVSFFNCVAWEGLSNIVSSYCHKGDKVAIEGRLQQKTWTAQDGKKMSAIEILLSGINLLTPKKQESPAPVGKDPGPEFPSDSDCPF